MVKRDKEGHYIMIKGSIHQEDITIVIIYAPTKYQVGQKVHSGFSVTSYGKNLNELFGQPNI